MYVSVRLHAEKERSTMLLRQAAILDSIQRIQEASPTPNPEISWQSVIQKKDQNYKTLNTGLPRFGSVQERFGKTAVWEIRFESVQGFGGSVRFGSKQIANCFGSVQFGSG